MKIFRRLFLTSIITGLSFLLAGCHAALLNPKGIIAASERDILVGSVILMLLIVIPVIVLSWYVAWKYRESNKKAKYLPNWAHSNLLEVVWWAIPCIIIIILSIITWVSSHRLDPYRPLDVKGKPILIQAVSLEWKWLFIYPDQHIATVNYIQIPVNQPVRFWVTSDAPMNSLEFPQLAGQIYAMAGMRTKLNLMATSMGTYEGLSTNYSGIGFSGMHFPVKVTSDANFKKWVQSMQHSPKKLTYAAYNQLAQPSSNNPASYYSSPEPNLFMQIMMKFMKPDNIHHLK